MHAIWLSIIAPVMFLAVWIFPGLRAPQIWFAIFLICLIGGTIWLGVDLYTFAAEQVASDGLSARILYIVLSETGKPIFQLAFASLATAILTLLIAKPAIARPTSEL